MVRQMQSYTKQIDALTNRQQVIVESYLTSKDKMIEQTTEITANLMNNLLKSGKISNEEIKLNTLKTEEDKKLLYDSN